ncbi:MAG: hypothetical protein U1E05_22210, partial [Patescibacteria group bacterium]|nr:hypothetical protein [Patescibacteria group bacterium]
MAVSTMFCVRFPRSAGRFPSLACFAAILGLTGPVPAVMAVEPAPVKFVVPDVVLNPEERARIDQAVPPVATAVPAK